MVGKSDERTAERAAFFPPEEKRCGDRSAVA